MTTADQTAMMTELTALKKFFISSQKELGDGKITSMVGIDHRISAVCQKVQVSSSDDQKIYLPELTTLIELMNDYEYSLRTFQSTQLSEAARLTDTMTDK